MSPRKWLLTTIGMLLLMVVGVSLLNMTIDIYGLFRDPRGRRLPVRGDERVAKYLLAMRYVPENFDAVMIGASVAANWDVRGIRHLRVYNASLEGGNIVEERAIVERALATPDVRVVFILVHPAMTYSHQFRTVEMRPELKRSALGSLSLLEAYKMAANIRLGRMPEVFDEAGTETFLDDGSEMNIYMKQMWNAPEFTVDPVALRAFKDFVAELRASGRQIVFVVPPIAERLLRGKRAPLDRYMHMIHGELGSADLWIDFLGDDQAEFRNTRGNFSDGVHLTVAGEEKIIAMMNDAVNGWIAQKRLVLAAR